MNHKRSVEEILTDDTVLDDELVEKISQKIYLTDRTADAVISGGLRKIRSERENTDEVKSEIKIDVVKKRIRFGYVAAFLVLSACLTVFVSIVSSKNDVFPANDSGTENNVTEITENPETDAVYNPENIIYLSSGDSGNEKTIDAGSGLIQYMIFSGNILYVCSSDYSFENLILTAYDRESCVKLFSEKADDEGWIKYIEETGGELEITYQFKDSLKSVNFSTDKGFYNSRTADSSFSAPGIAETEELRSCDILFCSKAGGYMNYDFIYIKSDGALYGYIENSAESVQIVSDISSDRQIQCAAADSEGIAFLKS